MTSSEIVAMFRAEMGDTRAPYLWDDTAEAFPYLDEAQQMFCRKTDGIADSRTPAVTRITLVPGTDWYATHPAILNIRKITRADDGRKVEMLTAEQADERGITFLPTKMGKLREVVLGLDEHAVRMAPMPSTEAGFTVAIVALMVINTAVVPLADTTNIVLGQGVVGLGIPAGTVVVGITPNSNVTISNNVTVELPIGTTIGFGVVLNLQVYRLPVVPITDIGDQALEIDSQHHQSLVLWMKHRAYGKQDTETFDRAKAKEFEDAFEAYCFKAKQEQGRARRVQGSVAYGGIPMCNERYGYQGHRRGY